MERKALLKKMVCLGVVFLLCFCFIGSSEAEAAGKVSVSMKNSGAVIKKKNKVSVKATLNNATAKKVTYSSNNKKVATVSSSGTVTGRKQGTAKITAKVTAKNGKTYKKTIKIYVKDKATSKTPYTSLSGKQTVLKGNKTTITPKLKNSKSSISSTTYKSSKTSVATVSSKGVVTAKKAGGATITATSKTKNGHTLISTRKVTVRSSANSSTSYISVSPSSKSLQQGRTQKLTTSLKNAGGTSVSSKTYKSSDSAVASVNSSGKITAKKAGSTTITVTAKTKNKQHLIKKVKITVKACSDHNYTSKTTAATCTADGKTVKTCSYCGKTTTTAIAKKGHSAGEWQVTKAATCTATGTRVKKCTTCGETVQTEAIEKTAHSAGAWQVTKAATCTATGTRIKKCTVCGETVQTETIEKTAHSAGAWQVTKEPTYKEAGTRVKECTACGEILEQEQIDKLVCTSHIWEEKSNTATCTSSGTATDECTVCGSIAYRYAPAFHNWVQTTNADGSWNYNCSKCSASHKNIREYIVNIGDGKTAKVTGYLNDSMGNEIFDILNEYRRENGLNTLQKASDLSAGADIRAYEIGYDYSHTRPDGSSCFTVVDDRGRGMAENIAYGYVDAAAFMNAWKNSEGHNKNMLNSSYTQAGISVFTQVTYQNESISTRNYGVQLFRTK